jgi:hypothetical protein
MLDKGYTVVDMSDPGSMGRSVPASTQHIFGGVKIVLG